MLWFRGVGAGGGGGGGRRSASLDNDQHLNQSSIPSKTLFVFIKELKMMFQEKQKAAEVYQRLPGCFLLRQGQGGEGIAMASSKKEETRGDNIFAGRRRTSDQDVTETGAAIAVSIPACVFSALRKPSVDEDDDEEVGRKRRRLRRLRKQLTPACMRRSDLEDSRSTWQLVLEVWDVVAPAVQVVVSDLPKMALITWMVVPVGQVAVMVHLAVSIRSLGRSGSSSASGRVRSAKDGAAYMNGGVGRAGGCNGITIAANSCRNS
ncbi:unnamed protein product [Sphagnum tenellum]